MAGGQWNAQNKVLPGIYINLKSKPSVPTITGERGTVAIARPLSWGEPRKVVEIVDTKDTMTYLGYDISSAEMLFIREIFRGTVDSAGAQKILLYRLEAAGGATASATIGQLTVIAKYQGSRGNDVTITIIPDPDTETSTPGVYACFTVQTIVDGSTLDSQYVGSYTDENTNIPATIGALKNNAWVNWTGDEIDPLTATAGIQLAGGLDGAVTPQAYSDFLTEIEAYSINELIYDGEDPIIKAAFVSLAKRLSYERGLYCQCVVANYPEADSEICISVKNGYMLPDETDSSKLITLTAEQATWWAAGASAGANYNQSLTYAIHPLAKEAVPSFSEEKLKEAVTEGSFTFFSEWGDIKVLTDINSLKTLTTDKGKHFKKNRVLRVLFTVANDIYRIYSSSYVGKIDSNEDGRKLLKGYIVGYLKDMQANGGIKNFTKDDVEVEEGIDSDAVVITLAIQPVDAIEKIYITVVAS